MIYENRECYVGSPYFNFNLYHNVDDVLLQVHDHAHVGLECLSEMPIIQGYGLYENVHISITLSIKAHFYVKTKSECLDSLETEILLLVIEGQAQTRGDEAHNKPYLFHVDDASFAFFLENSFQISLIITCAVTRKLTNYKQITRE
ncbi:hypothetical protein ACJX0J_006075 [Zea mays]